MPINTVIIGIDQEDVFMFLSESNFSINPDVAERKSITIKNQGTGQLLFKDHNERTLTNQKNKSMKKV
ncbi:MAG TPA: hypothetical protein VJH71_02455 [Candidatus Paceibacterota bacterium]